MELTLNISYKELEELYDKLSEIETEDFATDPRLTFIDDIGDCLFECRGFNDDDTIKLTLIGDEESINFIKSIL